ncbi:MAG: hypothetical protein K6A72_08740 [Lachnospiraceae bacterium]|nr:hypothetical protein [Lachnospiraceae bacterium]
MSSDSAKNKAFNKALDNFTFDMAGRGAVRHLFNLGMSAAEIHDELLYPVPAEKIREEIWAYLLENGVILLDEPDEDHKTVRYEFVKETNEYGRVSFRRVEKSMDEGDAVGGNQDRKAPGYIKVEFGKLQYKDPEEFERKLMKLDRCDRDYVTDLPWPLQPVWHRQDERIERIMKVFADPY